MPKWEESSCLLSCGITRRISILFSPWQDYCAVKIISCMFLTETVNARCLWHSLSCRFLPFVDIDLQGWLLCQLALDKLSCGLEQVQLNLSPVMHPNANFNAIPLLRALKIYILNQLLKWTQMFLPAVSRNREVCVFLFTFLTVLKFAPLEKGDVMWFSAPIICAPVSQKRSKQTLPVWVKRMSLGVWSGWSHMHVFQSI